MSDDLIRARNLLFRAGGQGNPEHKIGDALVAIGLLLLHSAETDNEGREDDDAASTKPDVGESPHR